MVENASVVGSPRTAISTWQIKGIAQKPTLAFNRTVRSIFFIVIALISFSHFAEAGKRLELNDDSNSNPAELRKRIRRLQEAVIELQDRVDVLESKLGVSNSGSASANVSSTCFIETPFDGVFDASAPTETKARIEAVKACMSKVKSRIHCSAEKVKCGQ